MTRLEATRVVAATLGTDPVVASLGHPTYDLFAAGDRPENFYTWGGMGLASSIGLGLALARPDRRVTVLDGDGSLLMNLGSLATIASLSPPNLRLIVWDNAQHGTTGGQPTATATVSDLAAIARGAGIARSVTAASLDALRDALAESGAIPGPWVIVVRVEESGTAEKPPLDCVFIKHRFMAALGRNARPEAAP